MGRLISMDRYIKDKGENMKTSLVAQIKQNKNVKKNDMPSIADKILKAYSIEKMPVPIVQLAKKLRFSVFQQEFDKDNISGIIAIDPELREKFGNDKIITVNTKDNLGHQRFTIAHELAHYLFDFDDNASTQYYNAYDTTDSDNEIEDRANFFAANLLMPRDEFVKKYNEYIVTFTLYDMVLKLSDDFQVSTSAIKKRIEELKL